MLVKAVLFDLDGTLLDTLEDLAASMNAVLERFGYPPQPVDDYRYHVGDGVAKLAARALRAAGADGTRVRDAIDAVREEYSRRWADNTHPYEGIDALLSELQARAVPMAILSNKPHDSTEIVVKRFFPETRFAAVSGCRDGVPRKPDPEGALALASTMAVPPENFLFVGDTDTDMKTARSARMCPVGALWGFRTEEELRSNGAAVLLARPGDLLTLL